MGSTSIHILANVRRAIDSFLAPQVLALAKTEPCSPNVKPQEIPVTSEVGEGHLELLDLRCVNEGLRSELEDARREAELQQENWERKASRDAAALARLTHQRDELEREGRAKRRRVKEVEGQLEQLRVEKDRLSREHKLLEESSKSELVAAKRGHESEQKRLRVEVSRLEAECSKPTAAPDSGAPEVEADALRKRVVELEHEVQSLRAALEQARPERELAAQLRKRHAEYESELQAMGQLQEKLNQMREQLEQMREEKSSLELALKARDAFLREAEEAKHSTSLVQRDLAAFAAVAAVVVSEAEAMLQGPGPAKQEWAPATPLDLSVAWARAQTHASNLRDQEAALQHSVQRLTQQEQLAQSEAQRLREKLSAANTRAEEQQLAARLARDEAAVAAARVAVLREALKAEPSMVRFCELEDALQAKDALLADVTKELSALRSSRASAAAAVPTTQAPLEPPRKRAAPEPRSIAAVSAWTGEGLALAEASRRPQEPSAGELERFRRATRKHVQEFREGLYGLLGWKVEMRGEGIWQLTSRLQGQALLFRLLPAEVGSPAQFELLATPWAERLQGDRQAMAHLEVHGSVPGFLAQVTVDLLAQRALAA